MALITQFPHNYGDWPDDQRANFKYVQDLCVALITASITERITTQYAEDASSVRIINWITVPANRAQLVDWLKRKGVSASPTLFTSGAEFSGMWSNAIKDLNIP